VLLLTSAYLRDSMGDGTPEGKRTKYAISGFLHRGTERMSFPAAV